MFQRIIDGISASTGTTVRLTSLAAGAALALFITTCFLCAAAFISVLEKYGPVQACLAGAGVFFLLTLTAAVSYWAYKRQLRKQAHIAAERAAKSTAASMLADPMLLATGTPDRSRHRDQAAVADPGDRRRRPRNHGKPRRRARRGVG
ncbi:cbb3-type cytochrome oxidase subunit 3 [Bradyrhizobium sp. LM3.6]